MAYTHYSLLSIPKAHFSLIAQDCQSALKVKTIPPIAPPGGEW